MALFIGNQHTVGITIQGDADIGPMVQHRRAQGLGPGGATAFVDVDAVGVTPDAHDLRPQFPQRGGRDAVGGAIGAVDDNAQPVQPQTAWKGGFGAFHIPARRIVQPGGATDLVGSGQPALQIRVHGRLDPGFRFIRQLEPVGTEQLDPVIPIRVVGSRDHDPQIRPQRARQHGDGRGRHRPHQRHIHPGGQETGHQRAFDHVARQARILAQQDTVAARALPEMQPRGLPQLLRHFDGHGKTVGGAPDSISAEQLSRFYHYWGVSGCILVLHDLPYLS